MSERLLLGDAVNSTALYDQTAGIEAYDLLAGETLAQNAKRSVVFLRLIEDGNDDSSVAYQEICITGRQLLQSPILSNKWFRHG